MTHFELLASKLSDAEISDLRSALMKESDERLRRRIGSFPALTKMEQVMACDNRVEAIRIYRDRTRVGLMEARVVIDTFLSETGH